MSTGVNICLYTHRFMLRDKYIDILIQFEFTKVILLELKSQYALQFMLV